MSRVHHGRCALRSRHPKTPLTLSRSIPLLSAVSRRSTPAAVAHVAFVSAPLGEAALVPLPRLRSPTLAGPSSFKLHLLRTMIRLHHVMPDPCAGKRPGDLRPAGRLDKPAIPIHLLAKAKTTEFREDRRPGRRAPRAPRQADPPLASGMSSHTRGLRPADVPLLPIHDSNRSGCAGCPATRIPTRTLVVRGAPHPRPHRCGIRLLAP